MLGYFRLLLAFGVLAAHVSNFLSEATSRAMVGCFFIVSGYLIALTIEKKYQGRPLSFYRNRILRVYPIYLIVALVTLFLYAPWFYRRVEDLGAVQYALTLCKTLLLTFENAFYLVAPAWSLPYELTFYLLAPFILGFHSSTVLLRLALFFILSLFFFQLGGRNLGQLILPFTYIHVELVALCASFVLFSVGSATYFASKKLSEKCDASSTFQWLGVIGLTAVIVFGTRYVNPDGAVYDKEYGYFIGACAYLSTIILLLTWSRTEGRYTKLAGDLTYPVYLVHWPLLNSKLFESDAIRNINQFASRLFPYGDLIFVILSLFILTIAISYVLVLFERKYISPLRA